MGVGVGMGTGRGVGVGVGTVVGLGGELGDCLLGGREGGEASGRSGKNH